ncbi:MAG: hypothetical protein U0K86_10945 [Agathobacter sp.]|nr:hypothetical protein [Agathobacter sp.]
MNLFEFLENINPDNNVVIEYNQKVIFDSKVCEITKEDACVYWIIPESIVLEDDCKMHIFVEHQEEIDRK